VAVARDAFHSLWSEAAGQFLCYDRVAGKPIDSRSVGGLLPVFAGLGDTDRMIKTIGGWRALTTFGVSSYDPADPRFEPRRYRRGPRWLIVNYLLADLTRGLPGKPMGEQIRKRTPVRRWGLPDDLVGTVVYLASPASDLVTGVHIPVDGGYHVADRIMDD
jgi:hypothetical protein